jgi:hypothetical protein
MLSRLTEDLDAPAAFDAPDLTAFCRIEEFGFGGCRAVAGVGPGGDRTSATGRVRIDSIQYARC